MADAIAAPATTSSSPSAAPVTATPTSGSPAATTTGAVPTTGSATNPVTDLNDACVYDPTQAAAAIAAGEPPTRRR